VRARAADRNPVSDAPVGFDWLTIPTFDKIVVGNQSARSRLRDECTRYVLRTHSAACTYKSFTSFCKNDKLYTVAQCRITKD